ncbi:hypothetical protein [Nesterenkonia natronophila]|nr:hypothetical protein [Nesterenkonia natronophila]
MTGEVDAEWMTALKGTSSAWSMHTMPRLSDIQVALEEKEDIHAVIVCTPPEKCIVRALRAAGEPSEALVAWQDFAESLVRLHGRFWQRMTVIDTTLATPDGFEVLAQRIESVAGITLSGLNELPVTSTAARLGTETVDLDLAALQLLSMRRPEQLRGELEAITLSDSTKPYIPELVESYLQQRSRGRESVRKQDREFSATKKDLEAAQEENSMIIEQLHKTQEELERYVLRQREQSAKIEALSRGREYRQAKVAELEQKVEGFRRGRDYRKERIAELESELQEREDKLKWLRSVSEKHRQAAREFRAESRERQERMESLEKRLADLDSKLKSMRSSRSWRYTKPLRRLNGTGD